MRYIIAVLVAIMIICTVQVIIHYELLTKHDKFMSQKSQTMYQDQPHAEVRIIVGISKHQNSSGFDFKLVYHFVSNVISLAIGQKI